MPYHMCNIVKQAPKLKKEPADIDKLNLINKFYWAYLTWKQKCELANVVEMKKYIKRLEKQIVEYDEMLSEANNEIYELKLELKAYEGKERNCKNC